MVAATFLPSRTNRSPLAEWWRSVDHMMLGYLVALVGAGLILSMAASPAAAARLGYADPFFFLKRHLFFALLGLGGAFALSLFRPRDARRIAVVALLGSIALLVVVGVAGHEVKGATRWIRLGGFSLQPSEFAKPAFVVFAAWMFAAQKREPRVPGIAVVFGTYVLLVAMLITQPDFGQSFLLTLAFAAVFFFAGISLGWLVFLMAVRGMWEKGLSLWRVTTR